MPSCNLAFEVDDVELVYRELSTPGVTFKKSPQKLFLEIRSRYTRERQLKAA